MSFRLHYFPNRGYTLEAMDAGIGVSGKTLAEAVDRLRQQTPLDAPDAEVVALVLSMFEMIFNAERPPSELSHPR